MALVLSGGDGHQMGVLTAERAVSAIPFGGKYRVIDFVLSNCCHSGFDRVGVITQHAPTSLHDHIGSGRAWDLDRRDARVLILQPYLTREHALGYRGTADAVARNWDVVTESQAKRTLLLPGDHVYKMDYRALQQTHERLGAAVTLAVAPVPGEESPRFGMVHLAENDRDRIVGLEEKPRTTSSCLASMGVALFETEVLGAALRGAPRDLSVDVLLPLIAAGERVVAHTFAGYWEDVGTLDTYYRANMDLLQPQPRLAIDDPQWPILTRDEERPPVMVFPGADIESSLVANGCRVAGRVVRSILFPGVTVEAGAEIIDSVVMQDVGIAAGARLERGILDKYAYVGGGATVGAAKGDLTLVGKYAIVPERGRVGAGAVLGVGAGPADFVDNQVPAGARIADRHELLAHP